MGESSVWVYQTLDAKKKLKRGRPEIGVRQISLQITDAHLTQLDAKAAQAGVTRSVWLRVLFDKIFKLMPDEPKPSYEDILRELGPERMSFMSEMLRPDQHEEREDDTNLPAASSQELTPEEERAVIERLEHYFGRKPAQQEISFALKQARLI
jgi:hypothetical protein